ncbi:hypothetical protein SODALDRAFT_206574 [Sodiomyces alkalinus F11]|uniref:Uncharacterized protein n=1 Tax=Sodiomyces alkalinus (strain CBS 110278 / VKM F-3762 / F11) TaxID=1314773 RepID=A0A3N2PQI1_SODAK|nr:hypothetical protein SODALDRAFT_206574 [Sodiomyces alkalinus F11]ROT36762.1 hypothetical protein SODALDRAFT_206574 [Sodiomyces alkalinus F11]
MAGLAGYAFFGYFSSIYMSLFMPLFYAGMSQDCLISAFPIKIWTKNTRDENHRRSKPPIPFLLFSSFHCADRNTSKVKRVYQARSNKKSRI